MELIKLFSNIKKMELEIQILIDDNHPSTLSLLSLIEVSFHFFFFLVYENNMEHDADLIKEKLLDLLEQAFPNPMFVNDLAK